MCRIAGIFDQTSKTLLQDITSMRDVMHRGGPDDAGLYIDDALPLAFGHRRLSLIDLSSSGHQPMHDLEGQLQLIFNGEIYNFKELKAELIIKGYKFKTQSDTEVILKAYQAWGTNCFSRFNGMFAFALFDKIKSIVLLARDHAGIKPLYYSLVNGKLIFGSEIRAFKTLNPQWPANENWKNIFLAFGHLPEPVTTLKNVQPLPKGSFGIFDLQTLKLDIKVFFKYDFSVHTKTLAEAKKIIHEKLIGAVERHLISDAPIGLFLSGGVDSSLLTMLSQPVLKDRLHTLSIIFEEQEFSEKKFQDIIIKKTRARHQSFTVTKKEFENSLDDILLAMDQPSTDGVNSYFISKYAHEAGLKAVLSGLGGDELFGGYMSFATFNNFKLIKPFVSLITPTAGIISDKYKKLTYLNLNGSIGYYLSIRGILNLDEISATTGASYSKIIEQLNSLNAFYPCDIKDTWNLASWIELNMYMQNQLLKDSDCMSMWHGLEIRVPFLDKDIVNATTTVSSSVKKNKLGKFLLIESFKNELPDEIWNRKRQGFTFPFAKWITNDPGILKNVHWSKNWAIKILNRFNEKI
jgi:asparagine synthase (glutamine-hydrolysing)